MRKEKKKFPIIILVLSFDGPPYSIIEEQGIRQTWLTEVTEDDEVIFYYGNHSCVERVGDKLFLPVSEGWKLVGAKTLAAFQYVIENYDFCYIYRTNSSSYVDIKRLKDYIKDKPKENYYNGVIGCHAGKIPFCSGSGFFLSKDLVQKVVENQSSWNHEYQDDAALSVLLKSMGIELTPGARRFDVQSLTQEIDVNHYHYRTRWGHDRSFDVKVMKRKFDLKKL